MTKVLWDQVGQRLFETGIDRGVLFIPNGSGVYDSGFAWNGLTTVTEKPSGATATPQFADNTKYLNLVSAETFSATVQAFTYPPEFEQCDGIGSPQAGVAIGQQGRKSFGMCYRTRVGNDVDNTDHGYKVHMLYGCTAAPSQKAYGTINDNPSAIDFSWDVNTTPVDVTGYKPTSLLVIDSTKVDSDALSTLEDLLYGTNSSDPSLPTPDDVLAIFAGTITSVFPTAPTYDNGTHTLTIPSVTGVAYYIGTALQTAGTHTVTADEVVTARPLPGYIFSQPSVSEFFIDYS
jgi:hypothetical protein